MRWPGDRYTREWLSQWLEMAARLDNQLSEEHKRDLLYAEMRKSLSIIPYAKPKNGDGKIYFQWIFLGRTEKPNLVFRPIQH